LNYCFKEIILLYIFFIFFNELFKLHIVSFLEDCMQVLELYLRLTFDIILFVLDYFKKVISNKLGNVATDNVF
jgi:hypothetical protein